MSFWARSRRFFDAKTADSDDVDETDDVASVPVSAPLLPDSLGAFVLIVQW